MLAVILSGCAEEPTAGTVSETRFLMDTVCTITLYGTSDRALLNEAFDLCAEYEAILSVTVEGSDIWRINHAGGTPVTIMPQTAELIRLGVFYGELSGGKFDITIGRLSALWDFTGESGIPSSENIESARDTVDFRKISFDGNTVQLSDPDARIDLGGIAKGYIADRVADFLKAQGVHGAVIDLGGDIAVVGSKPDGTPWRIGVRQPFGGYSELLGAVELDESSIVSSGTYERQFEENGIIYHHILDPKTGMPVDSDVISVTLVAESALTGDIVSTIVILAGSDSAADLFSMTPGFVGALLVLDSGELLEYGDIVFLNL